MEEAESGVLMGVVTIHDCSFGFLGLKSPFRGFHSQSSDIVSAPVRRETQLGVREPRQVAYAVEQNVKTRECIPNESDYGNLADISSRSLWQRTVRRG